MKKIILLWNLFLIGSITSFTQSYSGLVVDAKTQEPLAYVHIGVIGKNMGTISDEKGNFQINLAKADPTDILRFSMLGYQDFDVKIAEVQALALKKVELQTASFALPEVPVTANRKIKTENFGFDNATKTTYGWSGYDRKGTELAVPIRGIRDQLVLEFNFYLRFNLNKSVLFRLNIYTLKDGKPHESILRENIFFKIGKDKKWISVDLRPYHIVIDQDVAVSVEPIETNGPKSGMFFSYAKQNDGTSVFIRESSQSDWQQMTDAPFAFYLTVEK